MYVEHIKLKDLRGFSNLEFDLRREDGSCAGWTVFTGDNGSGKSALLKAIAIGLVGRDDAHALQPSFGRWIRHGCNVASICLGVGRIRNDDVLKGYGRAPEDLSFPAKLMLKNGTRQPSLEVATPDGKPDNYATPERTIWSSNAEGWFSCGYGPFRRVSGHSAEAQRLMSDSSTARYATMFQEAASLSEVDQWLRKLKHKELEGRPQEKQQLELLLEFLRDDLMPNEITVDRVDSDGLWLRDRNGVQLSWEEMSDGYRSALALLADIIRHLIDAFGMESLTERRDEKLVVARSGVVLIDEIDAHLHPEWQREIGFWLKQHFPNIQFLVTTHSPLVCQAADSNGLFVLPEPGAGDLPRQLSRDEYNQVIAARSDTILLSRAFGLQNTRSPRAVKARQDYSQLKAKRQSGAALTPKEDALFRQLELSVSAE